jgi:hypothetical protein
VRYLSLRLASVARNGVDERSVGKLVAGEKCKFLLVVFLVAVFEADALVYYLVVSVEQRKNFFIVCCVGINGVALEITEISDYAACAVVGVELAVEESAEARNRLKTVEGGAVTAERVTVELKIRIPLGIDRERAFFLFDRGAENGGFGDFEPVDTDCFAELFRGRRCVFANDDLVFACYVFF